MVKPLLDIADGRLAPLEKVRTPSRALARLEELAVATAGAERASPWRCQPPSVPGPGGASRRACLGLAVPAAERAWAWRCQPPSVPGPGGASRRACLGLAVPAAERASAWFATRRTRLDTRAEVAAPPWRHRLAGMPARRG
ncbi:hypothetical protein [Actinomadura madurae]|uniref:hypothetical protein n=1 Tax=Actinomadura madurae TaxID=1993 RepID=UPI0020D1FE45|nr:hypothetical protein [Actinomadura madurae]MCQ0004607.1 hypothetical protein [Actinomadura madurae]